MNTRRLVVLALPVALVLALGIACSPSFLGGQEPEATESPATMPTGQAGGIEPTVAETEAPSSTQLPSESPPARPTAQPTETIVHVTIPETPTCLSSYITDLSSKGTADERRAPDDRFKDNIYERPFTSQTMDYFAHIDIVRAELCVRSTWVYATLFLEGQPPADSRATYAVEIDVDVDSRGDWLVIGFVPPSDDWTTDGVRVLLDSNNDVGSITPMHADDPIEGLDGYDQVVFDQGHGDDPDAAWIRRDPEHDDRVQLAFKFGVIERDKNFLWAAFAEEGSNLADWYDFDDHFTLAQAGSPILGAPEYPLRALAVIDSTCRYAYGFDPGGAYPGVCESDVSCQPGPGWRYCIYLGQTRYCYCVPQCPAGIQCTPCTILCPGPGGALPN